VTYDRVVADGTIVTPDGMTRGSIGIRDGRIETITTEPLRSDDVLDARGHVVLPGAVDLHVHFNEPGRTHWEGWRAGSRAAAAGGVTTVVDMPLNAIPPTTTDGNGFYSFGSVPEGAYDATAEAVKAEALERMKAGIAAAEALPPPDPEIVFAHAYVNPPQTLRDG